MTDALSSAGLLAPDEAAHFVQLGHFAYEGGAHGDTWLRLERLFADPNRLQRAAQRLAATLLRHEADVVCGPLVGGALLGQWVARELDLGFVYCERQAAAPDAGVSYAVPPGLRATLSGRRVIVVDDVVNAGSATGACLREVAAWGGRPVAAACLIVRQSAAAALPRRLGLPFEALATLAWRTWPAAECALCGSGLELSRA